MEASISSIAQRAKVSVATVSRVLNNSPRVSPKTRSKIEKIMDETGYTPRVMKNRRAHLGLVIIEPEPKIQAYKSEVISGVMDYIARENLSFSLLYFPPVPIQRMDLFKELRERGCDAGLLACNGYQLPEDIFCHNFPLVVLNEELDYKQANSVSMDETAGTIDAARHLISLGHKHIAVVGKIPGSNAVKREMALKQCFEQEGLDPEQIITINNFGLYPAEESGKAMGDYLFSNYPEVTAVLAFSDNFAYGIMNAAQERGLQIPEDISIIGFNDFSSSAYFNPPLTVVKQPRFMMGSRAAEIAHKLFDGRLKSPVDSILPVSFELRKSTARCRASK